MIDCKRALVTTGRGGSEEERALALEMSARLSIPFRERRTLSIWELKERFDAEAVLIAKKDGLHLATEAGEFFFHPNMAHVRIKNLRRGGSDHLVEALSLKEGASVLDCTLGLGADAIVESFVVGEKGRVVALESEPLIEAVVSYGLKHHKGESEAVRAAMRRIETHAARSLDFLRAQEDNSFDAVYFDPMFRHTLLASENLNPLRVLANHAPLDFETLKEARRVARRVVVLKENARSLEFSRLGFEEFSGGKYSKVRYGVMRKDLP